MPPGAPGREVAHAKPVDRRKPDPERRREPPAARAQCSRRSTPFETLLSAPSRADPAFSKLCCLFLHSVVRLLLREPGTKSQKALRGEVEVEARSSGTPRSQKFLRAGWSRRHPVGNNVSKDRVGVEKIVLLACARSAGASQLPVLLHPCRSAHSQGASHQSTALPMGAPARAGRVVA